MLPARLQLASLCDWSKVPRLVGISPSVTFDLPWRPTMLESNEQSLTEFPRGGWMTALLSLLFGA